MAIKEDTGLKQNLVNQVRSFFKKNNERSYGTDNRYLEGCLRFARFLGEETHLQKMTNAEARHLYAYVDYMKEKGLAASTIMTDLSAIRFYYERNGSKNKMPENVKLDLEKRSPTRLDRSWLPSEIKSAYGRAILMGRRDVLVSLDFMLHFGLRINELASLKLKMIEEAEKTTQLRIIGKGARKRVICFEENSLQMKIIRKWIDEAKATKRDKEQYIICEDKHRSVEKAKKSLHNWYYDQRDCYMVKDRANIVEEGKKPRADKITPHGLRHTFAQRYLVEHSNINPKKARKDLAEELGHGRISVTRIYENTK